jgi:hypothetical protein|tara:strand:- start:355 stop:978 length:624 start_codon:yes stop_codon:yes gene_type:complete
MKISYAVTVCSEFAEIQRLLNFLVANKRHQDEIIVQFDSKNGDPEIETYLRSHSINAEFSWHNYEFNGDFSAMKNQLTTMCNGDYIYQIDADEMVTAYVLDLLPEVLQANSTVDVMKVPRINTVDGITEEHIQRWNWRVNDQDWINYPDYQWRIYKNNKQIKWINRVHEVLTGYQSVAHLPASREWSLIHNKTIDRQERQNKLYSEL